MLEINLEIFFSQGREKSSCR